MTVLIVGGDSEIGAALESLLSAQGVAAVATTRRRERAMNRLLLDLAQPPGAWPALPAVDAAVLCAAVSRVADCRRDPEGARRVNVDGVLALARRLPRACFILFLSTNHVLDGSMPQQSPDSPRNPTSAYGEQKAAAEAGLLALDRAVAILRLAKVLTPRDPLLFEWAARLRSQRAIEPFADIVNAPTPLPLVASLIARIVASRAPGMWQFSGDRDLTYAEIAGVLAQTLAADAALVQPVAARRPGSAFEHYPRFASLDSGRAVRLLGAPAPPATPDTVTEVCQAIAGRE